MAIHQTKRQSDLEKRLEILRRQVYGKTPDRTSKSVGQQISGSKKSDTPKYRYTDTPTTSGQMVLSDISYLSQDLRKILLFSSIAIGTQAILFILLGRG